MTLRVEVWARPGDAAFARKVADLPVLSHSFTRRRNGVGEGTITLPDSYPRLSDIYDAPDGASYGGVHSLIRVYDEATLVAELLPTAIVPQQAKGDHVVTIDEIGIESILAYGRLETFDWNGSDNHVSLFPDWKFGAPNIAPQFDGQGTATQFSLFVADETYTLSISATGGTFTLTVGGNTTAAIVWNATAATITTELEALASVTEAVVTTNDAGVHTIMFRGPENVSPDMTINTGGLTGGSATLIKVYDGFAKSGTTFTLTVDAQTTSALPWNASNTAIENALQALSTVADVTVTDAAGTLDDPWVITFYDPLNPGSVTANGAGLSGGTIVLTNVQAGADTFGEWTTSRFTDQRIDVTLHGAVSTFQLVDDTIGGVGAVVALEFVASRQFGGAQTIIDVTPGSTGQASVWVRSSSGTARYRWVLRAVTDELDHCIAAYPSCGGEFTLTANTWTQLTLSNIQIPAGVAEIIFRVAYVGTVEPQPGAMRIALPVYYEGLPAGTLGYILRTLYEDIIDPHGQTDPIYWDDGSGTDTPYLTLDFDDVNDSAGVVWQDDTLAIEFLHEQPYLHCVVSGTAKGGTGGPYVWRVVPDDPAAGTWLLQVFNPGGDPVWDLSGDDDCPVVRSGKDIVNRSARRFLPQATDMAVEGSSYQIARRRNAAAVTALGRIGGYLPDVDIPDPATIGLAAEAELAVRLAGSTSLAYQVRPDASSPRPLVAYLPGYTILVEDEPLVAKSGHVVDAVRVAYGRGDATYEVHFDSESFVGSEAVTEGVRRLLAVFKGVRPDKTGAGRRAGGGVIPWLIAASDSADVFKEVAGFVCTGTNDQDTIGLLTDAAESGMTEVWLAPGTYNVSGTGTDPILYVGCALIGLGFDTGQSRPAANIVHVNTSGGEVIDADDITLRNLTITADGSAHAVHFRPGASKIAVEGCNLFADAGHALLIDNGFAGATIRDCLLTSQSGTAVEVGNFDRLSFYGNHVEANDEQVCFQKSGTPENWWIAGNWFNNGKVVLDCSTDGVYGQVHFVDNFIGGASIGGASTSAALEIVGLDDDTPPIVVAGNILQVVGNAIRMVDCHHVIVSANRLTGFERHGIWLVNSHNNRIVDNVIGDQAAPNSLGYPLANATYDAILLADNSDKNFVTGNMCLELTSATNRWRYAINVSTADCNANVVIGNDIRQAGVTARYNDAGTATINTWAGGAGAAGDNVD